MEIFRVLVVYHFQKLPENIVGKQMEHDFLRRFSKKKKISGGNGTSFLYISLPSLHDYEVKMPNCKFYGGRKLATTNLFFSL